MRCFVLTLYFFILGSLSVESKIFNRCEFVNFLRGRVPDYQLPTWVCIANFESHFNTRAINFQSGDHGILQISQIYWCSTNGIPGKGCGTTCDRFTDDDITDDVACARRIFDEHQRLFGNGFTAWVAYNRYCRGDVTHYVRGC